MSETQTILINDMIATLIIRLRKEMKLTTEQAMSTVYNSKTVTFLSDESTGLYENGSLLVYEILKRELSQGRFPDMSLL